MPKSERPTKPGHQQCLPLTHRTSAKLAPKDRADLVVLLAELLLAAASPSAEVADEAR